MIKNFVLLAIFFAATVTYQQAHFSYITSTDYSALKLMFPASDYKDISTFDLKYISESVKPKLWLSRVPFIAGIANNSSDLFYYQYEPFGFSKLLPIDLEEDYVVDVAVSGKGHIFAITKKQFYVFKYQFPSKKVELLYKQRVKNAIKCVFNGNQHIAILASNNIYNFEFFQDKLMYQDKLSKKMSKQLATFNLTSFAFGKKNKYMILTEKYCLFFSKSGSLIKKLKNPQQLNIVDSTAHGDFIAGSTGHNNIYKYNKNGEFIYTTELQDSSFRPRDLVIYKPFGNLAIFDNKKGYYYSMETSLDVMNVTQIVKDKYINISVELFVTFPSELIIEIFDKDNEKYEVISKKRIMAGRQLIDMKKIDLNYKNGSIKIYVKALYSKSNKIVEHINLKKER